MIVAGFDTAWRKNSSALVILEKGERIRLLLEREWIPGEKPLRPKSVLSEAVNACRNRKVSVLCTDMRDIDHVADALEDTNIELIAFTTVQEEIYDAFSRARDFFAEEGLDLRLGSEKLKSQIVAVSMKPGEGGSMRIIVPSAGAAHGDIASAFVMGLSLFDLYDPQGTYVGKGTRRFSREEHVSSELNLYPDHSDDRD